MHTHFYTHTHAHTLTNTRAGTHTHRHTTHTNIHVRVQGATCQHHRKAARSLARLLADGEAKAVAHPISELRVQLVYVSGWHRKK
jgi:hypothetical protein